MEGPTISPVNGSKKLVTFLRQEISLADKEFYIQLILLDNQINRLTERSSVWYSLCNGRLSPGELVVELGISIYS